MLDYVKKIVLKSINTDPFKKVHTDDPVILYVKTLQLIFYANLLSSDRQSDESDWRKQATTTTNRHIGVKYFIA